MKRETRYSPGETELKWQKSWETVFLDTPDLKNANKPFYNLMMFPYPSAEGLHVGNMYAFVGSDIYGRYMRMCGHDVFEPIGLDGFGIHSENYALKIGKHPGDHTQATEKTFYGQLRSIGAMFDWTRTLETYDPGYYRYTQWLFVQMFKSGLAYRDSALVNWCPVCKTVLADEQVISGECERCGNSVIKRDLEQWFFRITAYAEKLLRGLETLDWTEKVKIAQREWIGKKEGVNISYPVFTGDGHAVGEIACFTTRPDTNFGAAFVAISPHHPFVKTVLERVSDDIKTDILKYIESFNTRTDVSEKTGSGIKTGIQTHLYCVNRLNSEKLPLYISDFVVMEVGTGAVVGVPGHDRRDFEFAQQFHLPVRRVVEGPEGKTGQIQGIEDVWEKEGKTVNSAFLTGMDTRSATQKVIDYLESKDWGRRVRAYHLRDWLISRQRYWGPPIPMIFCKSCAQEGKSWFDTEEALKNHKSNTKNQDNDWASGWYPVRDDELPVLLPYIEDFKPGNDGKAPLRKHERFYRTCCPHCGRDAVRETDVSDTFLDSSWYFLRYPSLDTERDTFLPFDINITKKWLPVDMYTGGAEHSVLHLMYARFVTMVLHDLGFLKFNEPFTKFFAHGLIIRDGAKMSKSKGNVVNPDEYIRLYGADALRLYLMFMGPFSEGGDFRDSAMEGMSRWVGRIWRLSEKSLRGTSGKGSDDAEKLLHKLVFAVTEDTKKRRYNTAIAKMMEYTNAVSERGAILSENQLRIFIRLLAPYAPYLAEEVWQKLERRTTLNSKHDSVHAQAWPTFNPIYLIEEECEVVVQVNGKLRGIVRVHTDEAGKKEKTVRLAQSLEPVGRALKGKTVRSVVFVPKKLVNFVIS